MTGAAAFAHVASAAQELNDDTVTPGLLGLGVVAGLAVATWLLIRSMNRHLRKIDFDDSSRAGKPSDEGGDQGGDRAEPAGPAKTDPPSRAG